MSIYEVSAPEVLAEDFGGEIVAINLESGRYYSLRGLAYGVWADLSAGHSAGAIRDAVTAVSAELGNASEAFIARLADEKLIRIANKTPVRGAPVAAASAAESGAGAPILESFDDMADLIKADPIHEVDEAFGWPVRKE